MPPPIRMAPHESHRIRVWECRKTKSAPFSSDHPGGGAPGAVRGIALCKHQGSDSQRGGTVHWLFIIAGGGVIALLVFAAIARSAAQAHTAVRASGAATLAPLLFLGVYHGWKFILTPATPAVEMAKIHSTVQPERLTASPFPALALKAAGGVTQFPRNTAPRPTYQTATSPAKAIPGRNRALPPGDARWKRCFRRYQGRNIYICGR